MSLWDSAYVLPTEGVCSHPSYSWMVLLWGGNLGKKWEFSWGWLTEFTNIQKGSHPGLCCSSSLWASRWLRWHRICLQGRKPSFPGSGGSPGEGPGNPHQCFCLENSIDRGLWQATVYRATKSQTQLSHLCCYHYWHVTSELRDFWSLTNRWKAGRTNVCFEEMWPVVLTIEQVPCPGSRSSLLSNPSTPVMLHWLAMACNWKEKQFPFC